MGQSTDAILFYGYCWDEEDSCPPWIERDSDGEPTSNPESDVSELYVARVHGESPPSRPFPRSAPYTPDQQEIVDEYIAYWKRRRDLGGEKATGVATGSHCSGDDPMWYVAIAVSVRRASRGSPADLGEGDGPLMNAFTIEDDDVTWTRLLDKWCREMKVDTSTAIGGKPRWWLVSDWN